LGFKPGVKVTLAKTNALAHLYDGQLPPLRRRV
jgi:hypothetical protein